MHVAHHADLLGRLALDPVVALAGFAQPVLARQHEVHEDGAAE